MIRIGHFIAILFRLGYVLLHKLMHYLKTCMNKPLIFPKNEYSSNIKIILHWHANKSEELVFDSYLESFQDTNHASEKILRSSYGIYMQNFLGTACSWKIHCLIVPTNSSEVELHMLHATIVRIKQHRLLLTSLGVTTYNL